MTSYLYQGVFLRKYVVVVVVVVFLVRMFYN